MEIDITDFFNNAGMIDYSASAAEIGQDAGTVTWRQACEDSPSYNMLDTGDKQDAFRSYVKGFGAWSVEEIAAWTDTEANALLMQMIAGDVRESDLEPDSDAEAWEFYYQRASKGEISGRMTRGDDGRIYYMIGD